MRPSRWAAILTVVAVGGPWPPARAVAAPHSPLPPSLLAMGAVAPGLPFRAPEAALRAALGGGATLAGVAGAQARLLQAPRRLGGSGLGAAGPAEAFRPGAAAGPAAGDALNKVPRPAGDLDGDGTADPLVVEFPEAYYRLPDSVFRDPPSRLVARSGADGHPIWSRPTSNYPQDFYLYFTVEGTPGGVGGPEPLVVTLDLASPGEVRSGVLMQTLAVLDGRTGAERWSRTFPAVFEADTPVVWGPLASGGLVVRVDRMPDATGDGQQELVVSVLDGLQPAERVTAYALDASDGSLLGTAQAVGAGNPLALRNLPSVVAGRSPTGGPVLVSLSVVGNQPALAAVPLGDVAPSWATALPADAEATYALPPVDGGADPAGGPVWLVERFDVSGRRLRLDSVAGADGSLRWSFAGAGYPDEGGDADGDGLRDVRTLAVTAEGIEAATLAGASGGILWRSLVEPPARPAGGSTFLAGCTCADDLNADGAAESVFFAASYRSDGTAAELFGLALDGRSGRPLWRTGMLASPDEAPLPAGADLTGDGARDVTGFTIAPGGRDEMLVGLAVRNGPDGSPAWAGAVPKPAPSARSPFVRVEVLPVATPGGRSDLAVALNEFWWARQPDGTLALRFHASVHLFSPGGVQWSA